MRIVNWSHESPEEEVTKELMINWLLDYQSIEDINWAGVVVASCVYKHAPTRYYIANGKKTQKAHPKKKTITDPEDPSKTIVVDRFDLPRTRLVDAMNYILQDSMSEFEKEKIFDLIISKFNKLTGAKHSFKTLFQRLEVIYPEFLLSQNKINQEPKGTTETEDSSPEETSPEKEEEKSSSPEVVSVKKVPHKASTETKIKKGSKRRSTKSSSSDDIMIVKDKKAKKAKDSLADPDYAPMSSDYESETTKAKKIRKESPERKKERPASISSEPRRNPKREESAGKKAFNASLARLVESQERKRSKSGGSSGHSATAIQAAIDAESEAESGEDENHPIEEDPELSDEFLDNYVWRKNKKGNWICPPQYFKLMKKDFWTEAQRFFIQSGARKLNPGGMWSV